MASAPSPALLAAITAHVARALSLRPAQVEAVLQLHAGGATVPFMARYRKEATGGLDEVQLGQVLELAEEKQALEERREAVLRSVEEQGKLTPELKGRLEKALTRTELEDLYLPFRPKRRTRAQMAREKGLEPLADLVWRQEPVQGDRLARVKAFVSAEKGVPDAEAALAGARDICAERVAEDAALRRVARELCVQKGELASSVTKEHKDAATKFDAYREHREPLARAPGHRVLALFRGEEEGVLKVKLALPDGEVLHALTSRVVTRREAPFTDVLRGACEDGWERLLGPSLEGELRAELKARADREAVAVFGQNLRHLLLAAPAGNKRVLALDPGLRTGVKAAVLDGTGRLLDAVTLYTERSGEERARAAKAFLALVQKHQPELVAVGNGTGSREAEGFVREALAASGQKLPLVSVSEQGASIYSASEVAREEFPQLDVSLRGAVSIGRRLQDPLAELVKLDPKSIGVGQYQHDVDQGLLQKKLGEVVDSCVNAVGVDVNTASPQLLEHVSGLGPSVAKKVVAHRESHGPFPSRRALLKVSGLGPRTFEQAAGFLRVRGEEPLDASAVHPERYPVVAQMARDLGVPVKALVGSPELVRKVDWRRYVAEGLGEPTLKDILAELEKPSRDPRGDFSAPAHREDLRELSDVKEGMVLEGRVTNVTAFGAFVDVGVHQDGLVHVSQLSTRFVKDPGEVVKVGDTVRVRVMSVDLQRKRLGLSIRAAQEGGQGGAQAGAQGAQGSAQGARPAGPPRHEAAPRPKGGGEGHRPAPQKPAEPFNNPFAKLKR
jgi:uncharacterized protein